MKTNLAGLAEVTTDEMKVGSEQDANLKQTDSQTEKLDTNLIIWCDHNVAPNCER